MVTKSDYAMRFVPLISNVEAGKSYKSFYKIGKTSVFVTVTESGVKLIFNSAIEAPGSAKKIGHMCKMFKSISGIRAALDFAEQMGDISQVEAVCEGFVLVRSVYCD